MELINVLFNYFLSEISSICITLNLLTQQDEYFNQRRFRLHRFGAYLIYHLSDSRFRYQY